MPSAHSTEELIRMPHKVKLLVVWLIVGFVIYAIVTSPDQAAGVLRGVWNVIAQGFASLGTFFSTLLA
ncbi:hypothetical protein [Paraoerskovia marina]|nr:hypothetical protein [Paraoerskovia marina]